MKSALVSVALVVGCSAFGADETLVSSPNGQIQFKLIHTDPLNYEVTFKNKPVVETSRLSFSLDDVEFTSRPEVLDVKTYRLNETYPWRGVHSVATNNCNGATIALRHGQSEYTLEVRAFDDAVAYRFIAPANPKHQQRVADENSSFVIPNGSRVWFHDLGGHYEGQHTNLPVKEVPAGQWIAPPLTFRLPGALGYAVVTEAALVNYSGMALRADGRRGFNLALAHKHPPSHPFVLRYNTNEVDRLTRPADIPGVITTPWRVVLIAADLNALVNSDAIANLCPPPDPKLFPQGLRTEWIKPGRAVWKYLDGGESTLEGTKEFCKLAKELGFEYNILENYWSRWTDEQLREVAKYAREQGVGLIVWKHSRNLRTAKERDEFFKHLQNIGIAGAKVDFFDHEHRDVVNLYPALLEAAARYRIVLDFHGANKPTGMNRTWPNELTREAIRGMESRRLVDRATHDVTLPFTRCLAGPADYTVVHFSENRRRNTTWTHQLASAVVFYGPLLTYAAHPTNLLANPAADLIKSIPPVWDETIVLPPSAIGEVALFARRSGTTWFLAAMNGIEPKTIQVPLAFLGQREFRATLVRDSGSSVESEQIETRSVQSTDTLTINLRAGGGFIGRFTRN